MTTSKDEQVAWVRAIAQYLGVSLTELARRAKIAPSTLQRPANDPDYNGMIFGRTLAAIAAVAGVRVLEYPAKLRGLSEPEATPFTYDDPRDATDNLNRAVRELCRGKNGRDPWVMRSWALELAGILPGDIMIVDLNQTAKVRDIVCAQVYDWTGMKSETIFRLYNLPFLVPHSLRNAWEKPLAVDDQTVVIKGVVTNVIRGQLAAA